MLLTLAVIGTVLGLLVIIMRYTNSWSISTSWKLMTAAAAILAIPQVVVWFNVIRYMITTYTFIMPEPWVWFYLVVLVIFIALATQWQRGNWTTLNSFKKTEEIKETKEVKETKVVETPVIKEVIKTVSTPRSVTLTPAEETYEPSMPITIVMDTRARINSAKRAQARGQYDLALERLEEVRAYLVDRQTQDISDGERRKNEAILTEVRNLRHQIRALKTESTVSMESSVTPVVTMTPLDPISLVRQAKESKAEGKYDLALAQLEEVRAYLVNRQTQDISEEERRKNESILTEVRNLRHQIRALRTGSTTSAMA